MTLNAGQQKAADIISKGGNLFLSGPAGYGKTYTLDTIRDKNAIVAAPTGAAALVANGMTNHRIFNAPVGVIKPTDCHKMKPETRKVLRETSQLILDEGSMLRADMLSHIDSCMKVANENDKPFGGKQVIAVGDFFQLPAFVGQNERDFYRQLYGEKVMAFESDAWNFDTVELTEPMRNTNLDQLQVLNSLRKGENVAWAVQMLNKMVDDFDPEADTTHLCAYNKDADIRNLKKYNEIDKPEHTYYGEFSGDLKIINKEFRVPIEMKVKEGMRIMTITNDEGGEYVNGSTGTIEMIGDEFVGVRLDNGSLVFVMPFEFEAIKYKSTKKGMQRTVVARLKQLPIIPAYGLSIYKAQGATLDKAVINLGSYTFSEAILYVAISRVRNLADISFVRKPTVADVKVNKKVIEFYKSIGQ